MFWLAYIPLYERLMPIFEKGNSSITGPNSSSFFPDVPNIDVKSVYQKTFSGDGIAVLVLQNFFNWFTGTVVWFPFMAVYNRLAPIFSTANNQRHLDESDACTEALILLSERLVNLLRFFAGLTDNVQG